MAEFTGFFSGLKEGRESLSETSLRNLQRQQIEQKMADEERTKRILTQAYSANSPTRLNDSYEEYIKSSAAQAERAGRDVMAINPEMGIKLIQQGMSERKNAHDVATSNLEYKKRQMEVAGQISAQVVNQETLDAAKVELSKVGTEIPERYQTWSPETKEWLQRRSLASESYLKSLQINQQADKIKIDAEEAASKQADRLAKQKSRERSEQFSQEKIALARKGTRPSKDELREVGIEQAYLSENDEKFNSLEDTQLMDAAKDVRSLTQYFLQKEPTIGEDVAKAKARRTVRSRITEDGQYKVVEDTAETPKITMLENGKPEMESWISLAMKKNPSYVRADIEKIYRDKYGK